MNSGVRWVGKKQALGPPTWSRAVLGCTIGAPSAGLSLDGLLASRALSVSPGSPTVIEATGTDKAGEQSRKVRIGVGVPNRCYGRKNRTL